MAIMMKPKMIGKTNNPNCQSNQKYNLQLNE